MNIQTEKNEEASQKPQPLTQMRILSIETSCDETAVAVVEAEGSYHNTTFRVRGNALYSQAKKHAAFGGVYPSLAKREHAANLVPLLGTALRDAKLSIDTIAQKLTKEQKEYLQKLLVREEGLCHALVTYLEHVEKPTLDAIAVTHGPGLEPALWVGINFARALSYIWNLPILPVNHLEGHIIASAVHAEDQSAQKYVVEEITFPLLGLIVSGGHTEFVYAEDWGKYRVVGATRDDSIGEAFDKVARLMGIPYPGGPELSNLANKGRQALATRPAHLMSVIKKMPRPMLQSGDLDFSFSGLKTAVLYQVQELGELSDIQRHLLCAEFEDAVRDVVITKTAQALEQYPARTFVLGGGVSANTHIRKGLEKMFASNELGCTLRLPAEGLSTDNAVMIGMAGYFMHLRNAPTLDAKDDLSATGNLKF